MHPGKYHIPGGANDDGIINKSERSSWGKMMALNAKIAIYSFLSPNVAIPLLVSEISGVPVTPSPQAMGGSAASQATIQTEVAIDEAATESATATTGTAGNSITKANQTTVVQNTSEQASAANHGRGTALEKQNNSAAQNFESSVEGAASDVATKKRIVPTLKYDNPNPNGAGFVKFDGSLGELNFIDRKLNVTGFPKSIDQVRRAAEALSQNPGSTLPYEVPFNKVNATVNLIRKAGQFLNPNITVVGVAPPPPPIK